MFFPPSLCCFLAVSPSSPVSPSPASFFFLAGGKVIMTVMTGMLCKDGIAGCWVRGKGSKVFCAGCVVWKALHLTSCYFYRPLQTCLSNLHCLSFNLKVRNYCSLVAVQKNKKHKPQICMLADLNDTSNFKQSLKGLCARWKSYLFL